MKFLQVLLSRMILTFAFSELAGVCQPYLLDPHERVRALARPFYQKDIDACLVDPALTVIALQEAMIREDCMVLGNVYDSDLT